MEFQYWNKLFTTQELVPFNHNSEGILWLKIKSIIRKDLIEEFQEYSHRPLCSSGVNKQFEEIYNTLKDDLSSSHKLLDNFIKSKDTIYRNSINSEQLESELYKLKFFDWGGDYQNSLDKYLVRKYIKTEKCSYNDLISKFESEVLPTVQHYVCNSWYNYWSSVLIENVFREHNRVIAGLGRMKSVDFFIDQVPFDLKVTYLPSEYIKQKRKEFGYPVELTYLKKHARLLGMAFDSNASDSDIHHEIIEKLKDRGKTNIIEELSKQHLMILNDACKHPKELAKWLYENQGEMRFGAENRIYLILVDNRDVQNSWKLKRNLTLLRPIIHKHLDAFDSNQIDSLRVDFTYKLHKYQALSDVIFIVNDSK